MAKQSAKERLLQPLEERGVTTPGQQIGPVRQPEAKGPTVIEGEFSEVKPAESSDPGGMAMKAAKWLLREAIMPALEKTIPQGASEMSNALFAGTGFVLQGHTDKLPGGPEYGIHGPPGQGPQPEQAQQEQPQASVDPLDRARSNAQEASQDKGKYRSYEIG